jgi:hypothetical protein
MDQKTSLQREISTKANREVHNLQNNASVMQCPLDGLISSLRQTNLAFQCASSAVFLSTFLKIQEIRDSFNL